MFFINFTIISTLFYTFVTFSINLLLFEIFCWQPWSKFEVKPTSLSLWHKSLANELLNFLIQELIIWVAFIYRVAVQKAKMIPVVFEPSVSHVLVTLLYLYPMKLKSQYNCGYLNQVSIYAKVFQLHKHLMAL